MLHICSSRCPTEPVSLGQGTGGSPDQLILDHYRGRSQYEPMVQGADCFLRREAKVETATSPGLGAGLDDLLASCGKPQTKPVPQFTLLNYQTARG